MFSDNQKNEFAFLSAEGVSFNFISQKHNVPLRIFFKWAEDLSGDICDLKIFAFESVTDSLKASANKSIPENQTKCHSFVIFLSIFFTMSLFFQFRKCHI